MAQKGILRTLEDGLLSFHCPGCKESHVVRIVPKDGQPCWGFNNNFDKPTFTPSILIKTGHYCSFHKPGSDCWCTYNVKNPGRKAPFECSICHSFVTDGQIQFLGDCTHELANKTVLLKSIT
jgi:hypothetical protein